MNITVLLTQRKIHQFHHFFFFYFVNSHLNGKTRSHLINSFVTSLVLFISFLFSHCSHPLYLCMFFFYFDLFLFFLLSYQSITLLTTCLGRPGCSAMLLPLSNMSIFFFILLLHLSFVP